MDMRAPTPAAPGPAAPAWTPEVLGIRQLIARWAFALVTAAACAGLAAAAALAPAPPAVIPLVAITCVAMPMLAGWQLPQRSLLRSRRELRAALAQLRRELDELPEAPHPLDL